MSQQRVLIVSTVLVSDQERAKSDQVILFCALLSGRVVVDQTREDKHRVDFVSRLYIRVVEDLDEIRVAFVFDQLYLAGFVNGKDLSPDECKQGAQLFRLCSQELEDVWEYSN